MTRYRIFPYRQGSASALALAAALNGRVLRLQGSTFVPRSGDVIINWGHTSPANFITLNGGSIQSASNKLHFFRTMRDAGHADIIPPFWETQGNIPDDAFPIVCRSVLAGHSGDGIHIADTRNDLVPAPLYVKYMKKKDEYRVHLGKNGGNVSVIAVQKKARRSDVPDTDVNWKVRNHQNGFIYKRNNINPPTCVIEAARQALLSTDLDFGAVDVIYNANSGRAYVLEINTAPGLEGTTVEDYANYFRGGTEPTEAPVPVPVPEPDPIHETVPVYETVTIQLHHPMTVLEIQEEFFINSNHEHDWTYS